MKLNQVCFQISIAFLTLLAVAAARAGGPMLDKTNFLNETSQKFERLATVVTKDIPEGQVDFIPITNLIRGQDDISIDNVFRKIGEKQTAGDVVQSGEHWKLSFDEGRSAVSVEDPVQVVKTKLGYVILDGHHDVFLSIFVGASTVAVKVVEDLSHLSDLKLWRELKARRLVYLKESAESLAKNPPVMMKVNDYPNRYLAALIALKVGLSLDQSIRSVKGSAKAVWIKINDSIPFVEFYIGNILAKAGIHYDSAWGEDIPEDVIEKARAALFAHATMEQDHELKVIPLIRSLESAARARNDQEYLKSILPERTCKELFR